DYIAALDGSTKNDGGWLNHHYIQLAYQLADSVSGMAYAFGGTCIILVFINLIPGLELRAREEDEILGIDDAEIGEFAYDYVEVRRDIPSSFNGEDTPNKEGFVERGPSPEATV
ncbi:hypothetical protein KEM55_005065, partial [Ascosphaera atra]